MPFSKIKVLFLCTGNSARSILGEYLLRQRGGERFDVASAGAAPTGRVNPLAQRVLFEDYGIDATEATSQSYELYLDAGIDLVITVCDDARDTCPIFPGGAMKVHWGSPDPAAFERPEDEALALFRHVAREIEARVDRLCEVPIDELSRQELVERLNEIGLETVLFEAADLETAGRPA